MKSAPIIFIHYGPARYLSTVFRAARQSSPDRDIHFLGDKTNCPFVPKDIHFHLFEEFLRGSLLRDFRKVFVPIAGRAHHFHKTRGVETWLRFVFERWFFIREFLEANGIESFWIFDSDTLIAGNLSLREKQFVGLDATEQCLGRCLNGWVSSRTIVDSYCEKMIELYKRPDYLNAQRDRLEIHSGLAFNEMDAWQTHRDEVGLKTMPLGTPRDGEAFDDALAITDGWQPASTKVRGRIPVKRIARDRRGGFFAFTEPEGTPVRLVTLNLSWLPDYVYRKLAPGCHAGEERPYDSAFCRNVDFSEPFADRMIRQGKEFIWKFRTSRKTSEK
ncbi:MAG: hypothetical protein ACK5LK_10855 [Chthoniobacterales bacterium]